jgi:2-polyprenyl-3-methyl-5-hydroxy-6-metoxy-1,4-benzoquinol methylase
MMDAEEIKRRKQEVVARFGPWTSHCIHLGGQMYTFDEPMVPQMDSKLRRFTQVAADIAGKPLETLRILDLACLEGHYGIEFALHGSRVVAIEGREANLAKAHFLKDIYDIDNLELILGDVRDLNKDIHGYFDVVLCLGILYHLDVPDALDFLERVFEVCNRATIIDTHVSKSNEVSYTWKGRTYWGKYVSEHRADATHQEKLAAKWASLDNPRSFWLTRASLSNALRHVGFSSVYECLNPYEYHNPRWPMAPDEHSHVVWRDRFTFIAVNGQSEKLISSPITDASPEIDRPEKPLHIDEVKERSGYLRAFARKLVRSVGNR